MLSPSSEAMSAVSVSVTLVRLLVEEIVRAGADPGAYLAAARVERALLDHPDARIELAAYDRLQELALDWIGDPALGLHMGERAPLSAFHLIGPLAAFCRTIRQALEVLLRYRKLLSDCQPPVLVEEGARAALTFHFVRGSARCNRLRAEFAAAGLVRTAQICLRVAASPLAVELEHDAPAYADEYRRVFGCAVRFNSASTRVIFARPLLDAPQPHPNAELVQLLTVEAERKLARLAAPPPVSERVRAIVSERVHAIVAERVHAIVLEEHEGVDPTMRVVARRLGLSTRSLRRRLQEEGRRYVEIVDEAMAEVAERLLGNPEISIQHVADRLGFSEPSSFHRAFKRWTGLTPLQFRSHALVGQLSGAPSRRW
jgi:AraC-like DNA-binding protein